MPERPDAHSPWMRLVPAGTVLFLFLVTMVPDRTIISDIPFDDAYISYRYAQHLREGDGLRFNPGEKAVEGYSNLLEVLLVAAFGGSEEGRVSAGLAQGVGAALVLVLLLAVPRRKPPWAGAALAAVLMLNPWFRINTWNGLETLPYALFALLTLLALEWAERDERKWAPVAAGVVAGITTGWRLDFAVWLGAFLVLRALADGRRNSRASLAKDARVVAGFAAVFVPFQIWRLAYYGTLIPNAYWVKRAMLRGGLDLRLKMGVEYLLLFAARNPLTAALAVPGLVWGLLSESGRRAGPLWFFLAGLTMSVFYGAGWPHEYNTFRYLMPLVPIGLYLLLDALRGMWGVARGRRDGINAIEPDPAAGAVTGSGRYRGRLGVGIAGAAGAVTFLSALGFGGWHPRTPEYYIQPPDYALSENLDAIAAGNHEYPLNPFAWVMPRGPAQRNLNILAGRKLRTLIQPGTKVATIQAGAFAYALNRPVVDLFGLNDAAVAKLWAEERYEHVLEELDQRGNARIFAMYAVTPSFSGTFADDKSVLFRHYLDENGYRLRWLLIDGDNMQDGHRYFVFTDDPPSAEISPVDAAALEPVCADPPECTMKIDPANILSL